jgi:hypothetical protein
MIATMTTPLRPCATPDPAAVRSRLTPPHRAIALAVFLIVCALPVPAQEDPADQAPTAPGVWQGEWTVTRDHPSLRTLAGSRLFELAIHHAEGSDEATLWWLAGPAICPEPLDPEPCEWIGATGGSLTLPLVAGRLVAFLPISADQDDPFVLVLDPPSRPGASSGALVSARGGVAWPVDARRDP